MARRQAEKERRREERLAKERAAAAAAARRRRLTYTLVGAAVVAALAATIALVASGSLSGGEGVETAETGGVQVVLPEQESGDLATAAKAAGCEVKHPEVAGQAHAERTFKASDYNSNPPTSGEHNPVWYEDGIYAAGDAPDLGMQVHTLEHGRINVQYRPGTPSRTVAELEALLSEQSDGYHMLLYENVTDMPYEVAATAWGHLVGCKTMNDDVFDALRTFRSEYIDQGPEDVP